jgi:transcriptional regulator with PAS, ATPase and Fis domain
MYNLPTPTVIEDFIPKKFRYTKKWHIQLEVLQDFLLNTLNEVNINRVFQVLLDHLCDVLSGFYARISFHVESGKMIYDSEVAKYPFDFKNKDEFNDKLIKIIKACDAGNHICLNFKNSHLICDNKISPSIFKSIIYFPIIYNKIVFGYVYFFVNPDVQHLECYNLEIVRNFLNYITPLAHKLINETDSNLSDESSLRDRCEFNEIVGNNPKLLEVLEIVSHIAKSEATILIQGECGTGKELIARAIHENSERCMKPFLPINCGAIPENLLESELFGHVRGAFTGAVRDTKGWFEKADGGTLFLDEVSKMSPALQIKLLRILQTGEYSRVGDSKIRYCDIRIIAATDKNLAEQVNEGSFREDVYYRLNVIVIDLPPLRDRKSDILPLAYHFLNKFGGKYNKHKLYLGLDAKALLLAYDYPGNIRELENAIERATVFVEGTCINSHHLPVCIQSGRRPYLTERKSSTFQKAKQNIIREFEYNFIDDCLKASKGNISLAAKTAGIDLKNFYVKMKNCRINPRKYKMSLL